MRMGSFFDCFKSAIHVPAWVRVGVRVRMRVRVRVRVRD
jgi:hypothetical protein